MRLYNATNWIPLTSTYLFRINDLEKDGQHIGTYTNIQTWGPNILDPALPPHTGDSRVRAAVTGRWRHSVTLTPTCPSKSNAGISYQSWCFAHLKRTVNRHQHDKKWLKWQKPTLEKNMMMCYFWYFSLAPFLSTNVESVGLMTWTEATDRANNHKRPRNCCLVCLLHDNVENRGGLLGRGPLCRYK